jgi:hypothetical protein
MCEVEEQYTTVNQSLKSTNHRPHTRCFRRKNGTYFADSELYTSNKPLGNGWSDLAPISAMGYEQLVWAST